MSTVRSGLYPGQGACTRDVKPCFQSRFPSHKRMFKALSLEPTPAGRESSLEVLGNPLLVHILHSLISFPPHLGALEALRLFFCISQKHPPAPPCSPLSPPHPSVTPIYFSATALAVVLGEASATARSL